MTRVRRGRPADRRRLFAIQSVALAEPWRDLLALALDGAPLLLVADRDDGTGPVGYALAVTGDDSRESSETSTKGAGHSGRPTGYLVELAVAPGERGRGHGTALLDALVDHLRRAGVDRLRVTARAVDDRALSFYRDNGFERRERLPGRYESGDGVLLVREIHPGESE